jgi:hypothetical protein
MQLLWRGLDLLNPDVTNDSELRGLRDYNDKMKGFTPPSHEFWLAHRPDVLKRKMLTVRMADSVESSKYPLRQYLANLHYYVVLGYREGIIYQIRQARETGATKGHILDTLAIAYIHGHARGMNEAAEAASEYMASWEDSPASPDCFPPGWTFDPTALHSGLDFSVESLSAEERSRIEAWYVRNVGEIPGYVKFLVLYRPDLLKAHRNRYENAIRMALPPQMMAYIMIHFSVIRGWRDGIREATLLGRSLGITKEEVVGAMCRAMTSYGGPDSLSIVMEATSDVLSSMIWS